eukprot:scaffold29731_cov23-Tisochrysis_lutea.AAC.5
MEDGGPVLMDLLWSDPTTNDAVQVRECARVFVYVCVCMCAHVRGRARARACVRVGLVEMPRGVTHVKEATANFLR